MEASLVDEVLACLADERSLFQYFPDRYALALLEKSLKQLGQEEQDIAAIRKGPYGKLMHRPVVKQLLSEQGSGRLSTWDLYRVWPQKQYNYVLGLGRWGSKKDYRWDQMSRPGENLVLQLNFNRAHDQQFDRALGMDKREFNGWYHPTARNGRCTLAWARLDFDLNSGQALIEEMQTDWLRDVQSLYKRYLSAVKREDKSFYFWGYKLSVDKAESYCKQTLAEHRIWQEAMLMATLEFLWQEIGIHDVYYHSYETGKALKNINYDGPPRSLYSDLPKRFCFQLQDQGPEWIEQCKPARKRLNKLTQGASWYRLQL